MIGSISVAPDGRQKRQKVDRELDLTLADPIVRRDARILEILRHTQRRRITTRQYKPILQNQPTLYWRYRGAGFPLLLYGKRLPRWKTLSPWMRIQIATLVLAEGEYLQFTIKLHDDLVGSLAVDNGTLKDYLRDRIKRRLRRTFGRDHPEFLFVVEDKDTAGKPVRPHAHGSIAVYRCPIDRAPHKQRSLRKREKLNGLQEAERLAGLIAIKHELKGALGIGGLLPSVATTGINQSRNLWTGSPKRPLFNHPWVTYAFKNTVNMDPNLRKKQIALSQRLNTQAQLLWEVIRLGEGAVPV